jgi:tRNA threonylcarbamoyladenosine biosynthesis protein TsaE
MDITFHLEELAIIVEEKIKPLLNDYAIIVFKGQLGAGKTTVIKELLKLCGIKEVITSPTFSYVNSYANNKDQMFHHFDLYRINSQDQFMELGFDEYFYQENSWCLIEWPEVINTLLKEINTKKHVYICALEHVYGDINKRRLLLSPFS